VGRSAGALARLPSNVVNAEHVIHRLVKIFLLLQILGLNALEILSVMRTGVIERELGFGGENRMKAACDQVSIVGEEFKGFSERNNFTATENFFEL
jgi:hypothetical protein